MRAALVDRPAPDAVPRPGERDEPVPGPGEALVRVTAAALGHLDVSVGTGDFAGTPPPPYVPCGDAAGVVVRFAGPAPGAPASDALAPGTPVWVRGGGLGVVRDGLAAELAAVPAAALHPCPADVDPALAACFFSPATSAALAVEDLGAVRAGERVLVAGAAGSVGSLAVQLAAQRGAQVVGTVSRPERLAAVPAPATAVVGDPEPGEPFDLLIDTVGGPGLTARLAAVRPGGRAVLVGYTAGTTLTLHLPTVLRADVTLLPLNLQRRAPQAFERAEGLLRRLAARELRLAVHSYPLGEVASAWADLRANRVPGRIALLP